MRRSSTSRRHWVLQCGIVLLAAIVIVRAAPAQAADFEPVTKAAPRAVSSWTGFYAGLGLGFRSTAADLTTTSVLEDGVPRDISGAALTQPFGGPGFRIAPYAGFNWQLAPSWLVGVEADVGFGDRTISLSGFAASPWAGSTTFAADSLSVKAGWDASLRGRAGYLLTPATLAYVTGGLAFQHFDVISVCSTACNNVAPALVSNSSTATGWTLGGGIETALWGNWLLRAEYRYADFGTTPFAIARTRSGAGPALTIENFDTRLQTHTASVGLAWKFGDPVGGRSHPLLAQAAVLPSWTGAYAGLGLGARVTRTDLTATSETIGGSAFDLAERANDRPMDNTTFRASPYAGYLWQVASQWVAGVEGDVGFADRTTTRAGFTSIFLADAQPPGNSLSIRSRWDASLRARAGYLVTPQTMLYGTGGAAWQNFELTSTCLDRHCAGLFALSSPIISQSTTKAGFTLGGGLETVLSGNWLARAEYRYADYGKAGFTVARASGRAGFNPSANTYDVTMQTHLATFGVTYRFQ